MATVEERMRADVSVVKPDATHYTQELDDAGVLASVSSVGDAYDNAMAESFVDTFKTELLAERSWRSRGQLELAVVEYVSWTTTSACTNPSATGLPLSSRTYMFDRGSTELSLLDWKPTKTVSVKPGPARTNWKDA